MAAELPLYFRFPPGATVRFIPVGGPAEMRPSSNDAATQQVVGPDGWLRAGFTGAQYGLSRFGQGTWGAPLVEGAEYWAIGMGDDNQLLTVRVKAIAEADEPPVQPPIRGVPAWR